MSRSYARWLCLLAVVLGSPQAQAQCDDKNDQGLLSAAFVTYAADGGIATQQTFVKGPNGIEQVSSERFHRNVAGRWTTRMSETAVGNITWKQQWDGLGRTVARTNGLDVAGAPKQRVQFVYDALGQLEQSSVQAGGANVWTTEQRRDGVVMLRKEAAGRVPSVLVDYDLGLPMTRQTIGSQVFNFDRGRDGRLIGIRSPQGSMEAFAYLGAGPAAQLTYGNGAIQQQTFDHRGRITAQRLGAELALGYEYGLDGNTRQASMEGSWHQDTLDLLLDPLGRVKTESLAPVRTKPKPTNTTELPGCSRTADASPITPRTDVALGRLASCCLWKRRRARPRQAMSALRTSASDGARRARGFFEKSLHGRRVSATIWSCSVHSGVDRRSRTS